MEEGRSEKHQNPGEAASQQQNDATNKAQNDQNQNPNGPEYKADPNKFLAKFLPGDPDNPQNFSTAKKSFLLFQMSLLAFVGSLGSSIITPAQARIAAYTNSSAEATVLTLSLFVLGYAFGPLVWAPVSEVYGRKVSMLPAVFILGIFSIGTATSTNAASIYVTRFFGGLFGSAPISNVSAALGDIYGPLERGIAMTFLAVCVVGGPTLAPVVGAAITVNPNMGWRCKLVWRNLLFSALLISTQGPSISRPSCLLLPWHSASFSSPRLTRRFYSRQKQPPCVNRLATIDGGIPKKRKR